MQVSGFSFVRNAITHNYPVHEAISSVLPLCDDFYLALGKSDDGTESMFADIEAGGKLKIIHTVWDPASMKGGQVFAEETDKAFAAIPATSTWAFYIQGDECVHEKDHSTIRAAMLKYANDLEVEGLLFTYRHFYGSYGYIGKGRQWYRNEIRIIRNDKSIKSWNDAQGFRNQGRKLKVKQVHVPIYHYGWAQTKTGMQKKALNGSTFYHGVPVNKEMEESGAVAADQADRVEEVFEFGKHDCLVPFTGSHPQVMQKRIAANPISVKYKEKGFSGERNLRKRVLQKIENVTGWRIGEYKNYKII